MTELRWQQVGSLSELEAAGGLMAAEWDRFKLALYLVKGNVFATANLCTHGGARLSDGYLEEHVIECPLHQGLFDVRTGEVLGPPCKRAVRIFPVRLNGESIVVGFPLPRPTETDAPSP